MRFITDSKELVKVFKGLASEYAHYEWAVAWAGKEDGFNLAKVLDDNIDKLEKLVVGLHFYQTSPDFIKHYIDNENVRFILKTDGIFHSKVYLFYNSESDWSAIVGSSNFTKQGFNVNDEANVLIESSDTTPLLFQQISAYIHKQWNEAGHVSDKDYEKYIKLWAHQRPKIVSLSKPISNDEGTQIVSGEFDVMNWDAYVSRLNKCDDDIPQRLSILDKAQSLFMQYPRFNSIPLDERKCLAGLKSKMSGNEWDWRYFGSMIRATRFSNEINTGTAIGKAIDKIPLNGVISKSDFDNYCSAFYELGFKDPLACATRLLAIKRPDWFICVDSKNRGRLCEQFEIPKYSLSLSNYWDKIVVRIRNTVWFKEQVQACNLGPNEIRLKNYQVAMLDCLYYTK